MKRTRFTETQIVAILKEADSGMLVKDICRAEFKSIGEGIHGSPAFDLYKSEWRLYHNFIMPSVKLIEKKRIASKTIKRYDSPKTPYQSIMESPHVSDVIRKKLSKKSLTNSIPLN